MFNGTTAEDFHVPVSKEMLLESIESYREAGGRVEHQARKEYLDWIVDDLIHERDALKMTVQSLLDEIKKDRVAFDNQAREFRRLKTEHAPLVQERNVLKATVQQLVLERNALSDSWEQERNITDSLALQRRELKSELEDQYKFIDKLLEQNQTLRDARNET